MRATHSISPIILAVLIFGSTQAQQPTGGQIMQKHKEQDRTRDSSVQLKMTLINARGRKRERRLTQVTKTGPHDRRKTLIRFLSPADVERTGFLSIEHTDRDDDNWLYLPSLRKTRRIAGSQKRDKFVGTEFAYEDLEAEDLNAHSYRLLGSGKVEGVDVWLVEATPTDPGRIKETGYSRRELGISKDHYLLIQAKFYDKKGRYVKLFRADDVRQVPGTDKWRAYRMTMEDLRKGKKTLLEFSDYRINQGIPDRYFSERYLKRGQ